MYVLCKSILHQILLQPTYVSIFNFQFFSLQYKRKCGCHHIHFIGVVFLQDLLFPLLGELLENFIPIEMLGSQSSVNPELGLLWQWKKCHCVNYPVVLVGNVPLFPPSPTYTHWCMHVSHSLYGIMLIFRWSDDFQCSGSNSDMYCDRKSSPGMEQYCNSIRWFDYIRMLRMLLWDDH